LVADNAAVVEGRLVAETSRRIIWKAENGLKSLVVSGLKS
jgi:hypothetical protein